MVVELAARGATGGLGSPSPGDRWNGTELCLLPLPYPTVNKEGRSRLGARVLLHQGPSQPGKQLGTHDIP